MIETLRERNFALLWFGGLLSVTGSWVLLAALPFYVYEVTGSALMTSGVLIAYIAPGAIFGSFAGVFVDRWNRKRTIIVFSLLQSVVMLGMLFVQSADQVWIIYVISFIESSLAQFVAPSENAWLPTLVGEDRLMTANSLNALNDNLARLGGPALGGALLAYSGIGAVVWIDAFSYLLVAVLVSLITVSGDVVQTKETEVDKAEAEGSFFGEMLAGFRQIGDSVILRNTFVVVGVALFGDAILSAILVVFVQDTMGLSSIEFGWLMTARGIGGLIGGILIGQFASRLNSGVLMMLGMGVGGILLIFALAVPQLNVMLPLIVVVGVLAIAWIISFQTVLQEHSEDAYRGRIFGAFGTVSTVLMLAGSLVGGFLTDQLGVNTLMFASCVIYIIAGVLAALMIVPPLRTHQKITAAAVTGD